jgi:hypothetical protein
MRVQIGPVESEGVLAWVAYAREVLATLGSSNPGPQGSLDASVLDAFQGLLTEWHDTAKGSSEFVWIADLDPEQTEFLTHAFHNVAVGLAATAEARGHPAAPPESESFYQALVDSVLWALQSQDGVSAAFAEEMRASWPGLRPN